MGVFLRWGVFGILAVAAMVYAYNASKRLTENRSVRPAPVVSPAEAGQQDVAEEEPDEAGASAADPGADPESEMPAVCTEELRVAELALKLRRDGEPIDRLLRHEAIAFESDAARRARLEAVARQWFEREGRDPDAPTRRREVLRDCLKVTPAP